MCLRFAKRSPQLPSRMADGSAVTPLRQRKGPAASTIRPFLIGRSLASPRSVGDLPRHLDLSSEGLLPGLDWNWSASTPKRHPPSRHRLREGVLDRLAQREKAPKLEAGRLSGFLGLPLRVVDRL